MYVACHLFLFGSLRLNNIVRLFSLSFSLTSDVWNEILQTFYGLHFASVRYNLDLQLVSYFHAYRNVRMFHWKWFNIEHIHNVHCVMHAWNRLQIKSIQNHAMIQIDLGIRCLKWQAHWMWTNRIRRR